MASMVCLIDPIHISFSSQDVFCCQKDQRHQLVSHRQFHPLRAVGALFEQAIAICGQFLGLSVLDLTGQSSLGNTSFHSGWRYRPLVNSCAGRHGPAAVSGTLAGLLGHLA